MTAIFDTETSGFSERRLLELGMLLVDDQWKTVVSLSVLVKPDNWKIEPGAEAVHGISQERAEAVGLPIEMVLGLFTKVRQVAGLVVCHNLDHDYSVMDGELKKAGWPGLGTGATKFYCTMKGMTGVCRLPASEKQRRAGFGEYKKPKLMEAYGHAFGKGFEGAHGGLADAVATGELFRWMVEKGHVAVPSTIVVTPPIPVEIVSVGAAFAPPPPAPAYLPPPPPPCP